MNISLITYHYSGNHGAVMQAYALCRYLKEHGHNVQIIDIRQDESGGRPLIVEIVLFFVFGYRIRKILRKYYPSLTKHYKTMDALREDPPISDVYIVGSDQVWNPLISKELMMAYFLDFGPESMKRISYASSFGKSKWIVDDPEVTEKVRKLLGRFTALSVREQQGKEICETTFQLSPTVVLDPVFLNDNYSELVSKVYDGTEFICYKMNRTEDFWNNIQAVGELLGVKPTLLNYNYPKRGFKYCFPPSLTTWLKKLATAKFIITDSFHGIAFSIIFRKQFVAILNDDGLNSRLLNLMNVMGLQERVFPSVEAMLKNKSWMTRIDYSSKEEIINKQVSHSREYLNKSLNLCR